LRDFSGHQKKIGCVKWNPTTSGVLASGSTDKMVKIWDVEAGVEKYSNESHTDLVQSIDWSLNGDVLVSSSKDKIIRVIDPRAGAIAGETEGLAGSKGSRVVFLSGRNQIATVGFNKGAERCVLLFDQRNLSAPMFNEFVLDNGAGYIMPFYDDDCGVLYLAGKGDGTVRYYELIDEKPGLFALSTYSSNSPQKGMCMLPKRCLDLKSCEVMRCLKIHNNNLIEPISFVVPRKMETFQEDIYPDMLAGTASQTADEWWAGTTKPAERMSAKTLFSTGFTAQASSSSSLPMSKVQLLEARVAELEAELAALKKENAALKK